MVSSKVLTGLASKRLWVFVMFFFFALITTSANIRVLGAEDPTQLWVMNLPPISAVALWFQDMLQGASGSLLAPEIAQISVLNIFMVLLYGFFIVAMDLRLPWRGDGARETKQDPKGADDGPARDGHDRRAKSPADQGFEITPDDREQWSDSIYFLGFLLTLVSLIIALTSVSFNNLESIARLLTATAAALSSTVAGLLFRTLYNLANIGGTLSASDDPLKAATTALAQTCDEARSKVSDALNTLSDAAENCGASIVDSGQKLQSATEQVAGAAKAVETKLSNLVSDEQLFAKAISNAVQASLAGTKDAVDAWNSELRSSAVDMSTALASLERTTSGVAASAGTFEENLRDKVHALGQLDVEQSIASAADRAMDTVRQGAKDAAETLAHASWDAANEARAAVIESADQMRSTSETLADQIRGSGRSAATEVTAAAQDLSSALQRAAASQKDVVDSNQRIFEETIARANASVDETVQQNRQALEALRAAISSLVDDLHTALAADSVARALQSELKTAAEPMQDSMRDSAYAIRQVVGAFTQDAEAAASDRRLLAEDLRSTGNVSAEARESLLALNYAVNALRDKLDDSFLDANWHRDIAQSQAELSTRMAEFATTMDSAVEAAGRWHSLTRWQRLTGRGIDY